MTSRTSAAAVSGPVTGGRGRPFASPVDVGPDQIVEEFVLDGVATAYEPVDPTSPAPEGRWDARPAGAEPYRTRMSVIRPATADRFSGTVVVTWQNVTTGHDLGSPSPAMLAAGHVWVGVSAQEVGVHGQPALAGLPGSPGMVGSDPERYGDLHHPGDAYSYDIFAQAARTLARDRHVGPVDPLGGLEPRRVIASGESQSAMRLGTYLNAVHHREPLFDAFLLMTNWGLCPALPEEQLYTSFVPAGDGYAATSPVRDDGSVPILLVGTETEAYYNHAAAQPDSDTFRYWPLAGTPHAPLDQSERITAIFAADEVDLVLPTSASANTVWWGYVVDAALQRLVEWVDTGKPPRAVPALAFDPGPPVTLRRDLDGNAEGGLRLPDLQAPTARNMGGRTVDSIRDIPGNDESITELAGSSVPLDRATLIERYGDQERYLRAWDAAVDDLLAGGHLLPEAVPVVRRRGRDLADERFAAR